jgi:hypothetical protein
LILLILLSYYRAAFYISNSTNQPGVLYRAGLAFLFHVLSSLALFFVWFSCVHIGTDNTSGTGPIGRGLGIFHSLFRQGDTLCPNGRSTRTPPLGAKNSRRETPQAGHTRGRGLQAPLPRRLRGSGGPGACREAVAGARKALVCRKTSSAPISLGQGYSPNSLRHQERFFSFRGISTPSAVCVLGAMIASGSS